MSDTKQIAIAIAPKFTALLSCCGSGYIMQDIIRSHRRNLRGGGRSQKDRRRYGPPKTLGNSAFYRIMLCLSMVDFMSSIAFFMTTWPIPKDENSLDNPSEIVYGNIGSMGTCTAQAFFIQLGLMAPFYNALLSSYYYLTMKREWKEEEFRRKVEYMGHFVTLGFGFGTAIAGLVMELYNNSKIWCWIAPYPLACGGEGQPECVRGINSKVLRWIFYYSPLWLCIFSVVFFMTLLFIHMLHLDKKMDGYTSHYRKNAKTETGAGNEQQRRQNTLTVKNKEFRAAIDQGQFYAGNCLLPWIFPTITQAMQLANAKPPWAIVFFHAIIMPSQGFFNFLVYVRPGVIQYFKEKRKAKQKAAAKPTEETNSNSNANEWANMVHLAIESQMVIDDDESDSLVMEEGEGEGDESLLPGTTNTKDGVGRAGKGHTTATVDFATGAVKTVGATNCDFVAIDSRFRTETGVLVGYGTEESSEEESLP